MVSLVVNSNSKNIKCANLFFKYFEQFVGYEHFKHCYLFIDKCDVSNIPNNIEIINYSPDDSFQEQISQCLGQVKDDIILYANEDYIFYEPVWWEKIEELESLFNESSFKEYSFIKFVHTDIEQYEKLTDNLFIIDKNSKNNFSQCLSYWRTNDLFDIVKNCPKSEIGEKGVKCGHLEEEAKDICRIFNIKGVCYYNGEKKRGFHHFDSDVYPHICSALVKGEWNVQEYPELKEILHKESIVIPEFPITISLNKRKF